MTVACVSICLAGGVNPYVYAKDNPLRFTDRRGLQPDSCVDPLGNRVECPRDICATAECAGGILPNPPPPSPQNKCRFECNVKPQIICTGAGITGSILGGPAVGVGAGVGCIVVKAVICEFVCDPDDEKKCK